MLSAKNNTLLPFLRRFGGFLLWLSFHTFVMPIGSTRVFANVAPTEFEKCQEAHRVYDATIDANKILRGKMNSIDQEALDKRIKDLERDAKAEYDRVKEMCDWILRAVTGIVGGLIAILTWGTGGLIIAGVTALLEGASFAPPSGINPIRWLMDTGCSTFAEGWVKNMRDAIQALRNQNADFCASNGWQERYCIDPEKPADCVPSPPAPPPVVPVNTSDETLITPPVNQVAPAVNIRPANPNCREHPMDRFCLGGPRDIARKDGAKQLDLATPIVSAAANAIADGKKMIGKEEAALPMNAIAASAGDTRSGTAPSTDKLKQQTSNQGPEATAPGKKADSLNPSKKSKSSNSGNSNGSLFGGNGWGSMFDGEFSRKLFDGDKQNPGQLLGNNGANGSGYKTAGGGAGTDSEEGGYDSDEGDSGVDAASIQREVEINGGRGAASEGADTNAGADGSKDGNGIKLSERDLASLQSTQGVLGAKGGSSDDTRNQEDIDDYLRRSQGDLFKRIEIRYTNTARSWESPSKP